MAKETTTDTTTMIPYRKLSDPSCFRFTIPYQFDSSPRVLIGFRSPSYYLDLELRALRLGIALAALLLVFIFFVPVVPYRNQAFCSTVFCQAMPMGGFYTGYNSLGQLFFHWGASLDTSFDAATYTPPIIMMTIGGWPSQLTVFGISFFILFPIALFIATLLSPEEWRMISAGLSRFQRWRDKQQE